MITARKALALIATVAAVALAGCKQEQAVAARSIQPLSPQLVSMMSEKGMDRSDPILLRIFKEESKAEIWKKRRSDGRYALLKSYDICRFSGKLGPKIKEGDKQAPEGFYSVGPAQMNPKSNYYLSFNIGYPNAYDRALGRSGQHVMMHGDCLSAGCYAMTDAQIGEIYTLAREAFNGGQKAFQVQALPFRMTALNMARRRSDANIAFWKNLKQGSDNFEVTKAEPKVDACGKKYVFNATTGPLSTFEPTAACPSYQVEPSIAKAVGAKEKADNILIAQLSKQEAPAPEYVAQNGRMRRTLDQPIVEVAKIDPAPVASEPGVVQQSQAFAAAEPTLASTGSVKPVTLAKGPAAPLPPVSPVALEKPMTGDVASTKVEGGLFSRMFGGEPQQPPAAAAPVVQPAAVSAPAVQVAKAGAPVASRKSGAREIPVDQTPVMASSVGSAPVARPAGIGGWIKGMFGSDEQPMMPAAAPPAVQSISAPVPAAAPARRDRQAALPDVSRPTRQAPRDAPAFAAFE